MGSSPQAVVAYGWPLVVEDEAPVVPWAVVEDLDEGDFDIWWRAVNGFVSDHPFASSEWFQDNLEWMKAHPIPVVTLYAGSFQDIAIECMIVPNGHDPLRTEWWDALAVPTTPPQGLEDAVKAAEAFIAKYEIATAGPLGWYVTAYYG